MGSARFKVVIVGDEGGGKSCLVRRFVDDQFSENYIPTLGFQIFFKSLTIGEYSVDFQIWDVAGQQSFEFARRNYYAHSQGFLLVFDLTNPTSFQNLEKWIAEVRVICPKSPFILVGNKADLPDHKIKDIEFDKKSEQLGASGRVLTSAKAGTKVKDAFDILGRAILTSLNLKS